jgi:phosphotransferase system  glucose/maltose/N-acetylglucosamine-specific IIC component
MLVLAIVLLVLGLGVGFLGAFATGMSDAPGTSSGVAPFVIGCLIASVLCFGLWTSGVHFGPILTR